MEFTLGQEVRIVNKNSPYFREMAVIHSYNQTTNEYYVNIDRPAAFKESDLISEEHWDVISDEIK